MFRHILVPLDGSLRAERVIPVAARIARASEGILILLRIINASAMYDQETSAEASLFQEAIQTELAEARQYLTSIASARELAGLAVIVAVSREPVIESIQATIHTYQADLLVCGEQLAVSGSQQFLGCFAENLSQHVSIPLLLLPEQELFHHSLAEWQEPVTCLVAFAGSQPEPFLIQPATSLLAAFSGDKPGHLHCVPLRSLSSRLAMLRLAQPVAVPAREQVRFAGQRALLLKDNQTDEKREESGEYVQHEIVVLGMPLLNGESDSLRDVCSCPRLLVPLPQNLSHT